MNYLPNAFAFIYVIDVSRAGGLQENFREKVGGAYLRTTSQRYTSIISIIIWQTFALTNRAI